MHPDPYGQETRPTPDSTERQIAGIAVRVIHAIQSIVFRSDKRAGEFNDGETAIPIVPTSRKLLSIFTKSAILVTKTNSPRDNRRWLSRQRRRPCSRQKENG